MFGLMGIEMEQVQSNPMSLIFLDHKSAVSIFRRDFSL